MSSVQPIFPRFMDRTKEWREQYESQWWRQDQYAEYHQTIGIDKIERFVQRVFQLFDEKLAKRWEWHPFGMEVFGKGTHTLESLITFGDNLLTVDGCLRLPSLEADLRNPFDCLSARLELDLAAHFKRLGYGIEFRPPLPNGRKSDFVVHSTPPVYFEIKRLQRPEHRLVVEAVVHSTMLALSDLIPPSNDPDSKGQTIEVEFNEGVTERLERRTDREFAAKEIISTVVEAVRNQLVLPSPNELVVPSIGKIRIGSGISSVTYKVPKDESRRILRTLKEAPDQLHPDFPGIVVLQSGEALQPDDVQQIGRILEQSSPEHLVSVLVVPEYFGIFEPFSPFKLFYVVNEKSRYEAHTLKAFTDLLTAYSKRTN